MLLLSVSIRLFFPAVALDWRISWVFFGELYKFALRRGCFAVSSVTSSEFHYKTNYYRARKNVYARYIGKGNTGN